MGTWRKDRPTKWMYCTHEGRSVTASCSRRPQTPGAGGRGSRCAAEGYTGRRSSSCPRPVETSFSFFLRLETASVTLLRSLHGVRIPFPGKWRLCSGNKLRGEIPVAVSSVPNWDLGSLHSGGGTWDILLSSHNDTINSLQIFYAK